MMYARRFADGPRFSPASLGAALAVNGAVIAAVLLANPDIVEKIVPTKPIGTIVIEPIPEPKPIPSPEPRTADPRPQPAPTSVVPIRQVITPITPINPTAGDPAIGDPVAPGTGTGVGIGGETGTIVALPKLIGAVQDSRYLADFQPPYPDYERDAGREGIVRLRIRIGVDGRVKQVERIDGRDSFARVSIAHALAKWRFKPATRGGVPEESWKEMTVRFTLND